MFEKQYFLIFLLLLNLFNNSVISQNKIPSKEEITILAKKATSLMRDEKFEESLIESRFALQYAIAIKDDNLIATCYNTIAANFDQLSEYEKALFYYKKGLLYAQNTNNNQLKNWLYNNLGNIYCFDKKEYTKGIYYYKKSLDYSNKTSNKSEIVFTKLNITWAYFDIGRFKEGLPYLNFINKYHDKYGDESTIVALNLLNAMYNAHQNDTKKAIYFFEKAIKLGRQGHEKTDLSFTHQEYSKFLFNIKEYKKAYKNLKEFNSINTELNYKEKLKKANVAGIHLEIDEYKREIDNIETKYKTKQQVLLDKQNKNRQISIIIISLLLIVIILFYFFFQNTKLKQKNKLKDVQSKIQENIITASINGQELERRKIASFLHDNISALLSSAGLHLSVFSTKNQINCEEIKKTKQILSDAHDKIRDLSHELLPSLLVRFGLFYALEDLCEKNSNSNIKFKYSSAINKQIRFNEDYEIKMHNIISELLNNIIKHSQATKAKLTLTERDSKLFINIKDNGKGFDTKQYHIIEGFGLNQIQARINNMQGEIIINSTLNKGTFIHIIAPIEYKV